MAAVGLSPIESGLGKPLHIPDIIEFVCSDKYLNRPDLYPRQATLLKAMFLQDDLFTQYDYDVIEEWSQGFYLPEHPGSDGNMRYQGTHGVQPDLLERIAINKADGRKWFRENVIVIGRRGGKGYIGALAGAYVLWHFLSPLNPQEEFAIDRDKRLAAIVFAGKLAQARDEQWKDLTSVILGAPCFSKYISRPQAQKLTVYSQYDLIREVERKSRGINSDVDMASFEIFPKESTLMAGRGPASFMLYFDEMAHVDTSSGASASAEDVYCLDPSTKVLTADLLWKPISELVVGEQLVAYDEVPVDGVQRKLRKSEVLKSWVTHGAPLRLTFEDGTSVVCSPNHRWLRGPSMNAGNGNDQWIKAGPTLRKGSAGNPTHLKVGDRIRHIVDPWDVDDSRYKTIVSIEELPEQELIDIETSTGTFIAEGLVSHNSSATPSLDQFGEYGFLFEGSSPWQMSGQFYENWQHSLEVDPRTKRPIYPELFMVQLSSWDPYKDWEIAHKIRMRRAYGRPFNAKKKAIQTYDDNMKKLEQANPETFAVERRSHWAAAMNAYLNPLRIKQMFGPFEGEPVLQQQRGRFTELYVAHGDPSKVNDNFGLAIAHATPPDEDGMQHVVFDRLHHWRPGDFVDNDLEIDYIEIEEYFKEEVLDAFVPTLLTFDQFGGPQMIQHLKKYARERKYHRRVDIQERTSTKPINWKMAEAFKAAMNMGLLHAPWYEQAELELTFLQDMGNMRVDHPTSGPVQSKDVADAMMNVVYSLIGEQMSAFLGEEFSGFPLTGALQGGQRPFPQMDGESNEIANQFGAFNRARGESMSNRMAGRGIRRDGGSQWRTQSPFGTRSR